MMERGVQWICKTGAYCFAIIVIGASGMAQVSDEKPPSGEAPKQKVDLSPQAVQAIHLKGQMLFMQKAAGSAKETICLVTAWYASDGTIQVVQLVRASGFPLVDQA